MSKTEPTKQLTRVSLSDMAGMVYGPMRTLHRSSVVISRPEKPRLVRRPVSVTVTRQCFKFTFIMLPCGFLLFGIDGHVCFCQALAEVIYAKCDRKRQRAPDAEYHMICSQRAPSNASQTTWYAYQAAMASWAKHDTLLKGPTEVQAEGTRLQALGPLQLSARIHPASCDMHEASKAHEGYVIVWASKSGLD